MNVNAVHLSASASGQTHVGLRRDRNEDFILIDDDIQLFLVCDGVGGRAGGDLASKVAATTFVNHVRKHIKALKRAAENHNYLSVLKGMHQAAHAANNRVHELSSQLESYRGMRTTLTALLILGKKALMAHVGDSRLYLLRQGRIKQISQDHTVAARLERGGMISKKEARDSYLANVLTRVIGRIGIEVTTLMFNALPGDRFLLCSDGLTRYFGKRELVEFLKGERTSVPKLMVQRANEEGGEDNTSAVIIDIENPTQSISNKKAV